MKFLAHHWASDTGGIRPKIGFRLLCRIKYLLLLLVYSGGNTNGVQGGHEECQK